MIPVCESTGPPTVAVGWSRFASVTEAGTSRPMEVPMAQGRLHDTRSLKKRVLQALQEVSWEEVFESCGDLWLRPAAACKHLQPRATACAT
eukprot:15441936-Alexandrium_andersonii.AAC.1